MTTLTFQGLRVIMKTMEWQSSPVFILKIRELEINHDTKIVSQL